MAVIDRILHLCFCINVFFKLVSKQWIKCLANLAFELFASIRLINPLEYEQSCQIFYACVCLSFNYVLVSIPLVVTVWAEN